MKPGAPASGFLFSIAWKDFPQGLEKSSGQKWLIFQGLEKLIPFFPTLEKIRSFYRRPNG